MLCYNANEAALYTIAVYSSNIRALVAPTISNVLPDETRTCDSREQAMWQAPLRLVDSGRHHVLWRRGKNM